MKAVLLGSNCQTVDWNNMYAQLDCGIGALGGNNFTIWQTAVESQFNITYWPYVQTNNTRPCLEEVMAISLTNLMKQRG